MRKRFTERQVLECLILHGVVIPCHRCRNPFDLETVKFAEREHPHEVALDGPDTPADCFYSHKDCHRGETFGHGATTAGSSIGRIAKTKRIVREGKFTVHKRELGPERKARRGHKIPSRPFSKTHRAMRARR